MAALDRFSTRFKDGKCRGFTQPRSHKTPNLPYRAAPKWWLLAPRLTRLRSRLLTSPPEWRVFTFGDSTIQCQDYTGIGNGPVKLLFRYPYGNSSCETNQPLHSRGYRIVGWHVDSCDRAFDKAGSVDAKEALSCGVLAQNRSNYVDHVVSTVRAHNGGIVLMHEIHPNTIKKLEEIIVRLKQEGFIFGSIEDPDISPSLR